MPIGDFVAAWGPSTTKPQIAFAQSSRAAGDWSLAVRGAPRQIGARYHLTTIAEAHGVELRLLAHVAASAPVHQHRFRIAPELQIEDVLIVDGDDRSPVRWSRTTPGSLVVFFDQPIMGERVVSIAGRM